MQETFEIQRVTLYKPEDGFFIATTTGQQKLIGSAIIQPHGKVVCEGKWETHRQFGKQFKVDRIIYGDLIDIIHVLLSGGFVKGIKAGKCEEIIKSLGVRTFEVLDACVLQHETKLPIQIEWKGQNISASLILMKVKGIGPKVYKQIVKSWAENKGMASVAVMSIRAGLTIRQFKNAIQEIGSIKLEEYILTSPYSLTEVDGFSWETVDSIAAIEWEGKLKTPHDSPQRAAAAVREVIRHHSMQGHTCMMRTKAMFEAAALARLPGIENRIDWETAGLREVGDFITTKKWHDITSKLAMNIKLLMYSKFEGNFIDVNTLKVEDYSGGVSIGEEQIEAVKIALSNNVSIITGQPGTGKSTITNTILNVMDKHGITYTLCAPTGAAKSRLSQVTGRMAHTLHKYFQFNREDIDTIYLETDYLFVDEASMNDSYLLYMTIDRLRPGQRIIFIGDANQLPPVSPGEPLLQMIDAGVPTAWLRTIYRNQGGIVEAAAAILAGKVPVVGKKDADGNDNNFMVVRETEGGIKNRIISAINWLMQKGYSFDDIQVLTPLNKNAFGRHELNIHLQDTFNQREFIEKTKFRIGDRVIHSKNNYELGVMNGEVGKIIEMDPDMFEDEASILHVDFTLQEETICYDEDDVEQLQLAYASTIHKFQGQEVPVVILVMPPTSAHFYLRQLPYTGITRAKKFCIVLDVGGSFESYIKSQVSTRRQDLLSHFLTHEGV